MKTIKKIVKDHAIRLFAIGIILMLYAYTRLPQMDPTEKQNLSKTFQFTEVELPSAPGLAKQHERAVHPAYQHIDSWISSVGAGIALSDLDGDGLPNDICHVDPRFDQVIISPVPGTGQRYATFILDPGPLHYDAATMAPMGCVPSDLNEDGQLDILVYYWGRAPIIFLQNAMQFKAVELLPGEHRWFSNAATVADFDGDGHADIFVGNYFPDGGRVLDAKAKEFDQVMQHSMSRAFNGAENKIFLWQPSAAEKVAFQQVSNWHPNTDVANDWTLAVGAADLDGDLLPEIYVANDFGPDRLLYNRSKPGQLQWSLLEGERHAATPGSFPLGKDSFKGMGVDFGDVNGDGWLDIYVSNIAAEYALEESHFCFIHTGVTALMADGIAPFENRSEPLGLSRSSWSWESRFGDFNNDTRLEAIQATGFIKGTTDRWPELQELAIGNDELLNHPGVWPAFKDEDDLSGHEHNPFFVQDEKGRFFDLAKECGLARVQVSRGIATADVDHDGALDFAVANQWETSYYYHNEQQNSNAFLGLRLLLAIDNGNTLMIDPDTAIAARAAIGATATVHHPNGQRLIDYVDGGNGHSGVCSPELHFGLGSDIRAEQLLKVELHWRGSDGKVHHQMIDVTPGWHTVILGTQKTIG